MTDLTSTRSTISNSRILRFAVAIIALIELAFSAPALPLLADPATLIAQGLTGWMILANILVTPLLAVAALVFAILGQLRNAVFALGALILAGWVNTAMSAMSFGMNFEDATLVDNILVVFQTFVAPLLATFAIVLAGLKHHIALGVVLVSLPTLVNVLSMAAVAIGMAGAAG